MAQILTQNEINSLMTGLESGEIPVGSEDVSQPNPADIVKYDFASQSESIGSRLPAFENINETFARGIRNDFSKMIGYNIDVINNPIETLNFGDLIKSLPVPMSLHIFSAKPLKGNGLLYFDSKFLFNFIDTIFGGPDTAKINLNQREFTNIENIIIQRLLDVCFKNLFSAWRPIQSNIEFKLVKSEFNPQFANITTPDEIVIISVFDIEFAKSLTSLAICMPYFMIESLRDKLAMGFHSDIIIPTEEWESMFISSLIDSSVDVRFELGSVSISGEELIDMKKGDVIQLNKSIDDNIFGFVNDIKKISGVIGKRRGQNAFKVMETIQTDVKDSKNGL